MKSLDELKKQAEVEVESDKESNIISGYKRVLKAIATQQTEIKRHEKEIKRLQVELKKVGTEPDDVDDE